MDQTEIPNTHHLNLDPKSSSSSRFLTNEYSVTSANPDWQPQWNHTASSSIDSDHESGSTSGYSDSYESVPTSPHSTKSSPDSEELPWMDGEDGLTFEEEGEEDCWKEDGGQCEGDGEHGEERTSLDLAAG